MERERERERERVEIFIKNTPTIMKSLIILVMMMMTSVEGIINKNGQSTKKRVSFRSVGVEIPPPKKQRVSAVVRSILIHSYYTYDGSSLSLVFHLLLHILTQAIMHTYLTFNPHPFILNICINIVALYL